ncbi:[FeFe] hydrogenase H-cluster radical SAM maturase HydE [Proteiniphilum sp. X52]|uniref:[FeFe] hydrogenase H-cluster radical SAM maturase HydE n=1 Tax=Proteiniphilum sp. X52 TaxID=2382159 RepID=UPI0021014501|nr:[FeFe] hydrogenase H-cluster radical SAM maturase HydE [Proteiniphilum sp. X52]
MKKAETKDDIMNRLSSASLKKEDIVPILKMGTKEEMRILQSLAMQIKQERVGRIVYFRGLVEFSNLCRKNCFYCGLRKENKGVNRFRLSEEEILQAAAFAHEKRYGSLVLQSGENQSEEHIDFICRVVEEIKSKYDLGITLSCGEQSEDTYRRFLASGAHRYLLRIETSSPELYGKWHPGDGKHSFETRLNCLKSLKKIGFQVGSGSMVGVPYQTLEDIAGDILFLRDMEVDMMGIGPFVEHSGTPFYRSEAYSIPREERLKVTLTMIAVLRILLKDVNIASTTAMQALDKFGREKGLLFGANVIMPNLTPATRRKDYLLYEHKPDLDEDALLCDNSLEARIASVGETIGYGQWGDPLHFFRRINHSSSPS